MHTGQEYELMNRLRLVELLYNECVRMYSDGSVTDEDLSLAEEHYKLTLTSLLEDGIGGVLINGTFRNTVLT